MSSPKPDPPTRRSRSKTIAGAIQNADQEAVSARPKATDAIRFPDMPASFYNVDNMFEPPEESGTRPSYGRIRPNSFNPTLKESPDVLLDKMLRSGSIMIGGTDDEGRNLTPQQTLKEILDDPRWTPRMLEDWFKKGPPSKTRPVAFSPDPEFMALYLVILSKLEEQGKEKATFDVATAFVEGPRTQAQEEADQRDLIRRTEEHFGKQQESRNLY